MMFQQCAPVEVAEARDSRSLLSFHFLKRLNIINVAQIGSKAKKADTSAMAASLIVRNSLFSEVTIVIDLMSKENGEIVINSTENGPFKLKAEITILGVDGVADVKRAQTIANLSLAEKLR
nr:hypothetical protein [Tanacetum cinerariifolium]